MFLRNSSCKHLLRLNKRNTCSHCRASHLSLLRIIWIQIQISRLIGEKWFATCFLNGILNWDCHWIAHVKNPTTFNEALSIILWFHRTSSTNHKKPEFATTLNVKFIWKRNQSSDTLDKHQSSKTIFWL